MRTIEIITKNNGKKKSQSVKIKKKSDLNKILEIIDFFSIKDSLPDIDFNGSISFRLDGEKINPKYLRAIINKALNSSSNKDENSNIQETDSEGRIIIHSRREANSIKNDKKKKKKKKNKTDKKYKFSDKMIKKSKKRKNRKKAKY